nr:hypothetical protein [Tanacetum cinerariifolium]
IGAARPTFSKTRPHIAPSTVSKSKAPFRRPFIRHTSPKPSISPLSVNADKPSAVSAARVNAANSSAVSAARVNAARLSAVRNISYLSDFKELNGGYAAFGGNPKGGKITDKGGTFMKRRLEECYDLIENMTAHHNDWDTYAQRGESSSSITSSFDPKIVALKAKMAEINKNLMKVLHINQQEKAVTHSCETCSGP